MNAKSIECLLVTANCGSVFEDPSTLLDNWIKEFLTHVESSKPKFIALHLQEVGGKTYEKSLEYVQQFITALCESPELKHYDRIRIFLDEDYKSAEHFTALGNLYFAHNSIENLKLWNFAKSCFEDVLDVKVHSGNIETIETKEKKKFPQKFFPECKWSRKGFIRTRWTIEGTTIDLVNIHLFHDASNLASCEQFPSVYCKSRRRALVHTLERIHKDPDNVLVPFFIFGDFNFRCDTDGVVKKLTTNLIEQRIPHLKTDYSKVIFRDSDGSAQLTVGKKEFSHTDHQIFKQDWLKQFDRELEALKDILFEFPINFPPTYPFEEDPQQPHQYMPTRCPSWCDRILMTKAAKNLIDNEQSSNYGIIGKDTCMGDHKPVYLELCVKSNQGIVNLCDHALRQKEKSCDASTKEDSKLIHNCLECLNQLDIILNEYEKPLPMFKSDTAINNQPFPSVSINVVDADNDSKEIRSKLNRDLCEEIVVIGDVILNRIDSQFLSSTYSSTYSDIKKLKDPYTPESIESHSPLPEMSEEKDFDNFINVTNDDEIMNEVIKQKHDLGSSEADALQNNTSMSHSISLSQLQTRLEILRRESQIELKSKSSGSGLCSSNKKKATLNARRCLCCNSCVIL